MPVPRWKREQIERNAIALAKLNAMQGLAGLPPKSAARFKIDAARAARKQWEERLSKTSSSEPPF